MHINDKFSSNEKISFLNEYDKLERIYNELLNCDFGNYISLREAFSRLFRNYKRRGTYIDYNEFEKKFLPIKKAKTVKNNSWSEVYIEFDDLCIYIEFLLEASSFLKEVSGYKRKENNILEDIFENIGKQLFFLDTQINNLIDLMQCEIKEVDGFKNIVKKEEVANIENAFDNSNRPIKNKFYEYIQTSNRTNLHRKREILSSLSNDWDGIKNNIKNDNIRKQVIDDLNFLLNNFNIRHNNNDNNNIAKIPEKELIGIYNIVYKYFLYAYTLFNVQELNCEVEKIKEKYKFK